MMIVIGVLYRRRSRESFTGEQQNKAWLVDTWNRSVGCTVEERMQCICSLSLGMRFDCFKAGSNPRRTCLTGRYNMRMQQEPEVSGCRSLQRARSSRPCCSPTTSWSNTSRSVCSTSSSNWGLVFEYVAVTAIQCCGLDWAPSVVLAIVGVELLHELAARRFVS